MRICGGCGGSVAKDFRFCPWCAAPLRLKLVELFRGDEELSAERSLRVSRYFGDQPHVRFSVWHDAGDRATAEAVVALDDQEATRLVRFLADSTPPPRRPPSVLERLAGWRTRHGRSPAAEPEPCDRSTA